MSKIYVIRERAFWFNDQYHFAGRPGGIVAHFTDEADAREELQQLQIKRFQQRSLYKFEEFCRPVQANMQALRAYLTDILDKEVMEYDETYDRYWMKDNVHLNRMLTDEQLARVIDIMDFRYYELHVFEEPNPVYYILWIPRLNRPLQFKIDYSYKNEPDQVSTIFYESRETLFASLDDYGNQLWRIPLEDTLENLSDTPELLASYVQDKRAFQVEDGKLSLQFYPPADELIGFNALLKIPLFEVRTIPFDEAVHIPHEPFARR